MLVDANILLYAVDEASPFHDRARGWLQDALNAPHRVGIPWQSLTGFVRITTHPRASPDPLSPAEAWRFVAGWLERDNVWTPTPGRGHGAILGRLVLDGELRGNLVSDASLAALCLEHGLRMVSADSDFARFEGLSWTNPLVTG